MARGRPFRAAKITDECFAAVIRAFMASPKFQGYSPATREVWGRELRLAERPDTLGAISVNVIRPALVQAFMDGMSDRPGKQTAALAALRQLERWGIVRDLLPQPITLGVEIGRSHDGHKPWTDEQVRLAETHARGRSLHGLSRSRPIQDNAGPTLSKCDGPISKTITAALGST